MERLRAALGSLVFLLLAPGVVAGVVPWLLTGWDSTGPPLAAREQVPADSHGALLVDGTVGTEGRDHGREKAFVGTHAA